MVKNLNFDGGGHRETHTGTIYDNIVVPEGWIAYWKEGPPVPNDPTNDNGYGRIEMEVINWEAPFVDPPRLHTTGAGHRALKYFTFFRAHDAGVYQRLDGLHPGDKVELAAWAHAWSSTEDSPRCSGGDHVGCDPFYAEEGTPGLDDGDRNFSFYVGVDPTGGTDPWGDNVVWGKGAHIYNAFSKLPAVKVTAQSAAVTLFLRSKVLWPFKHCDAYWDDVELTITPANDEEPTPQPTPDPPTSEYNYPVIAKGSKLGVHTLDLADVPDLMQQAPICTVKCLDPCTPLVEIELINAGTITVGRFMHGVDSSANVEGPDLNGDLEAEANKIMDSLLPLWRAVRAEAAAEGVKIDYWEICNELDPVGTDGHVRFAEFFKYCMPIAEEEDFKILLFSYSMGVPEWEEMGAIVETGVFAMAKAGGHALALHEYAYPIDKWFGDPLPGRPTYPDRGALAFRYRWLYEDFLIPRGEVIPLFITEFQLALGKGDDQGMNLVTGQEWIEAMEWYDTRLREDYYVLGAHMFTLTNIPAWEEYDFSCFFPQLISYLNRVADEPNALPPQAVPVDPMDMLSPREAYERTYLLLPPSADVSWFFAVGDSGIWDEWRVTVGGSADDAGVGLKEYRKVIAVNPGDWPTDLEVFFDTFYPGIVYIPIEAANPTALEDRLWELVYGPPVTTVPEFSQRDLPWRDIKLGESQETMYGSGCLVTAVAAATVILDPEMDPLKLVTWLNANNGFTVTGELILAKPAEFINGLEFENYYTWRGDDENTDMGLVREALLRGPVIIQVDHDPNDSDLDSHFVVAIAANDDDDDFWVMDPWKGETCLLLDTFGRGALAESIFAMIDYRFNPEAEPEPEPEPTRPPYIGFNDHEGVGGGAARFLSANLHPDTPGAGFLMQPAFIGGTAWDINASELEAQGIRTIVNLRYSWSTDEGGGGTLPLPYTTEWEKFVDAAVATILGSQGVWGWTIGNEYNNKREFPRDGVLTPVGVVTTYNYISYRCLGARLAPGALDPFNAEYGDPRGWLSYIFSGISMPDFVAAHGYIRGPDASLVGSAAKFTDDPLRWQYLNYPGCITALLESLPDLYKGLPVYVTELNHLWRDGGEAAEDYGWVTDARAAEVVRAAYAAAEEVGFAGLALYRWTGDAWAVKDNSMVLDAVAHLL